MPSKNRAFSVVLLCMTVSLALALLPRSASPRAQEEQDNSVPAFHDGPPKGDLPPTLSPSLFGNPAVQNAYAMAGKVKKVLYQQPCYCHCDRHVGHTSLLDCFASKHGSGCDVCLKEATYSYEQSQKGKTAAQIRAGIQQGEWRQVDMSKYQQPVAAN